MRRLLARYRKHKWGRLYAIVPDRAADGVVQRTKRYDRIGPITLPLRVTSGEIRTFVIHYYIFYASGEAYCLLTRSVEPTFVNPLIRISSNCNWAFTLGSVRCDCEWELREARARIATEPKQDGLAILAMDQHGKSVPGGPLGHALVYALGQSQRRDLVHDAYLKNGFSLDYRKYDDVHTIINSLGIRRMRLLTNNPERINYFRDRGIETIREAIEKPYEQYDSEELGVKREKLDHLLVLYGFTPEDVAIYGLDPVITFPDKDV